MPLGLLALRSACRRARIWNEGRRSPLFVSVKVSPGQPVQRGFLDSARTTAEDTRVDPATIHLEVTESVVAESADVVMETLAGLRAMGFRIAIDDFGTGCSSLSHIKRLPAQILTIDRSFVMDIEHDQQDREIVNAIVGLSHAMGMRWSPRGSRRPPGRGRCAPWAPTPHGATSPPARSRRGSSRPCCARVPRGPRRRWPPPPEPAGARHGW